MIKFLKNIHIYNYQVGDRRWSRRFSRRFSQISEKISSHKSGQVLETIDLDLKST